MFNSKLNFKTCLVFISTAMLPIASYADSSNFTGAGQLSYTGGNVGIGTSSPSRLLHLEGNVALFSRNTNSAGFIIRHTGANGVQAVFGQDVIGGTPIFVLKNLSDPTQPTIFNIALDAPTNAFYINSSGNVGMGTQSVSGYKLSVDGGIRATTINVSLSSTWADYVFKDDYKLMPLKDVKEFIDVNGHLPGVPTAEDVAKNGIDVAKMTKTLLEKVEELTLHMIELKQENEFLKEKIASSSMLQKDL